MNQQAVQKWRRRGLNIAEVTFYSAWSSQSRFCRSTFQPEGQRATWFRRTYSCADGWPPG
jgi:hypothetical protein